MSDHSEVLASIDRVHTRIGAIDEKVEKLGTTTGVLQVDVAVMAEKLKNTKDVAAEARAEARKSGGIMGGAVGAGIAAIAAAIAKALGGGSN